MKPNLPIPHGGYHWDGITPHFFEGWYFRAGQDFAFMYSLQNPVPNQPHSGGAVQILGPRDEYVSRTFPDLSQFWASRSSLSLLHWGKKSANLYPQILSPQNFSRYIQEGYQITPTWHQGAIAAPVKGTVCQWQYHIEPVYTWGNPRGLPKATADWLSYLPIFDPGWQVLMAAGLASGWIKWQGTTYTLTNAPFYAEKNWGKSFPQKWFWLNCNHFGEDISVTAVGSLRENLGVTETVGLIGIHAQNQFYEFTSLNAAVGWRVMPWGQWEMEGKNGQFRVKLKGNTEQLGTWVRVPTRDGLQFQCRDTTRGHLKLELWDEQDGLLLSGQSHLAGLEIGGRDWQKPWIHGISNL